MTALINSPIVKQVIHSDCVEVPMIQQKARPLNSNELLSGIATQLNTDGTTSIFSGTAHIWVMPPDGSPTENNVTCAAVTGAWSYLVPNSKTGTWKAVLHVPGPIPTSSEDYEWEVGTSAAPAN